MPLQRQLSRTRLSRKSKPPAIDRLASSYAVGLTQHLDPLLGLVKEKVLPMTAPTGLRTDAASFKTLMETFGLFRFAFMQQMQTGAELDAWRAVRGINEQNKDEFERVLNIDLFQSEPWLRPMLEDWVQQNVSLVRGLGEQSLSEMEQIVLRMVRDGESIVDIRRELIERFQISMNRARFIARDQVSKINGLLTEERQTRVGVTEYTWRTSEDIRVRGAENPGTAKANHARLNDTIQKWSEPPLTNRSRGERNHPGGDYQCRCWADPVLDKLLA